MKKISSALHVNKRVTVGIKNFRAMLTDYANMAAAGATIDVTRRGKEPVVLISKATEEQSTIAETPLPSGHYAAHYRHGEIATEVNEVLGRTTRAGATRIAQFAVETEAREKGRDPDSVEIPRRVVSSEEEERLAAQSKAQEEAEAKANEELARMKAQLRTKSIPSQMMSSLSQPKKK